MKLRKDLQLMDIKRAYDIEHATSSSKILHDLWPLDEVEPKNGKFPCCLVWTPLPVVSWLAPFIGHVGICREDGVILDFSGSNLVNADTFEFGPAAKYLQLDRQQCCFPRNLAGHSCRYGFMHAEYGTANSWDDALHLSRRKFEHKTYNLFTCNSHSFLSSSLNQLAYSGSMDWNMVNVAALVLFKGHWTDKRAVVRAFLPFALVLCLGILMVGWPFLVGLFFFALLLTAWFLLGTFCVKTIIES